MDGVGHGTELAERYRLEERLLTTRTWQFWRAVDTTLERSVGVMMLDPSTAAETTDAARRAALVEDPRLLRVLDAGTEHVHQHPVTYVVCEFVDGVSLETLLLQAGTLGADTVRTMVGESAQALAHAAENGLHHGRLRPASVLRTVDGSVRVAGLAIEAAAEGGAGQADPARADALALVALIYAGLTGRWPLRIDVSGGMGLEPAPMVSGVPVPPGDLVSGVPNDLDTLCAVTFGPYDDGPRTPAEVAEELRPWRGQGEPPAAATAPPAATGSPRAKAPPPTRQGEPPAAARTPTARTMRPPSRFPVRLPAGAASVGAAGGGAGAGTPTRDTVDFARPAGTAPMGAEPWGPEEPLGWPDPFGPADPLGQYATHDTDEDVAEYEDAPRRNPRVVIAAVVAAVAVVVALWMALGALTGPDAEPTAEESAPPAVVTTPTPTATSPTETEPATTPIQIDSAEALDPGGDGSENNEIEADAVDGDPDTVWKSETYNTAAFGGLKEGVGLAVSLSNPATVTGVTLTVNGSGGSVELRTASGPTLDGSRVVATADVAGGTLEIDLDEPVETQHLVVWFTELPEVGGEFRVELAEVDVR